VGWERRLKKEVGTSSYDKIPLRGPKNRFTKTGLGNYDSRNQEGGKYKSESSPPGGHDSSKIAALSLDQHRKAPQMPKKKGRVVSEAPPKVPRLKIPSIKQFVQRDWGGVKE